MSSLIFFNLDRSKILSSCNGLDDKIAHLTKLKAFVDNKINGIQNVKFVL